MTDVPAKKKTTKKVVRKKVFVKKAIAKNITPTPAPKPKAPKVKKEKKPMTIYLFWAAITVAIIIITCGIIYGYYYFSHKDTIAEYTGGNITKNQFTNALKIEAGKYDPIVWKNAERSMAIKKDILEDLIKDQILATEAKKLNIKIDKTEFNAEVQSYKSGYTDETFKKMLESKGIDYSEWLTRKREKYLVQKMIKQEVVDKIPVTEEELKAYYKDNKAEFSHPEQVRARHILASNWDNSQEIVKDLKNGANFAVLAKQKSISPERWKGGDLGYFAKGTHPEVFDRVCFNLPVGETSQPVRSEYGYHIFKIIDKRGPVKESLADATPYITIQLQRMQSGKAFQTWFNNLNKDNKVKIDMDMLKQIEVFPNAKENS